MISGIFNRLFLVFTIVTLLASGCRKPEEESKTTSSISIDEFEILNGATVGKQQIIDASFKVSSTSLISHISLYLILKSSGEVVKKIILESPKRKTVQQNVLIETENLAMLQENYIVRLITRSDLGDEATDENEIVYSLGEVVMRGVFVCYDSTFYTYNFDSEQYSPSIQKNINEKPFFWQKENLLLMQSDIEVRAYSPIEKDWAWTFSPNLIGGDSIAEIQFIEDKCFIYSRLGSFFEISATGSAAYSKFRKRVEYIQHAAMGTNKILLYEQNPDDTIGYVIQIQKSTFAETVLDTLMKSDVYGMLRVNGDRMLMFYDTSNYAGATIQNISVLDYELNLGLVDTLANIGYEHFSATHLKYEVFKELMLFKHQPEFNEYFYFINIGEAVEKGLDNLMVRNFDPSDTLVADSWQNWETFKPSYVHRTYVSNDEENLPFVFLHYDDSWEMFSFREPLTLSYEYYGMPSKGQTPTGVFPYMDY
jgi:hypothetical protein